MEGGEKDGEGPLGYPNPIRSIRSLASMSFHRAMLGFVASKYSSVHEHYNGYYWSGLCVCTHQETQTHENYMNDDCSDSLWRV